MAINQCDGCLAGIPVDERGFHRMSWAGCRPGGHDCSARVDPGTGDCLQCLADAALPFED
jgi:hypothetical protein